MMKPSEIQAYKSQLLELRARLAHELNRMIEALPEEMQATGNLSNVPTHNADRDSEGLDKEVALMQNEEEMLELVDEALERIENGKYGQCVACDRPIADERLQALPYIPTCIACASKA